MDTITPNQSVAVLKDYVSAVLFLEKRKYELETAIEAMRMTDTKPKKLELHSFPKTENSSQTGWAIIIAAIAIEIFLFITSGNDFILLLLLLSFVAFPLAIIYGILTIVRAKKEEKATMKIAFENKCIIEKNESFVQNADLSKKMLQEAIQQYNASLKSVNETLQQYYSLNIIYPKYRNLSALYYIFEYIDSGRAKTMVETYNFYEEESRLDQIITKLDVISFKLDTIISQLSAIGQGIAENTMQIQEIGNRLIQKAQRISESQEKINSNLANISENVEITKKAALVIEANQYYQRNWQNMRGTYDRIASLQ